MDYKENYRSQLEDYLLGKDLPHVLKELSGCRMDHEVLENFKEESNVAHIESGDLEQVKYYGCNKEFKRKKSNAFVTISTKKPGYTCTNRGKGCKVLYCWDCFTARHAKGPMEKLRRKSKRNSRR